MAFLEKIKEWRIFNSPLLTKSFFFALQPLLIAEISHSESRGENHQANGEDVAKWEVITILEGVDPI